MKLKINEENLNYLVSVVKIDKIYDIPNADRIKRTVIQGNDVIIGNEVSVGDVMLYFVSGIKLNYDFCVYNNLLTDEKLNKDGKKGYVSPKKLFIKALKLKNIVSNGLLMPLSSLKFIDENLSINDINVDNEFNVIEYNDKTFVMAEKYIPKTNERSNNSENKKERKTKEKLRNLIINNQFKFHNETSHLAKNLFKINDDDELIVTRKFHGSSGILSNVLITKKLTIFDKILKFFGYKINIGEYGFIWSSGKPKSLLPKGIESESNIWKTSNMNFYKEDIWKKSYNLLKSCVEKGITLYFEITGVGIQGEEYTYGKDFDIHIYRITSTNVDGNTYEFGWNEVIEYCNKYQLQYCQEYERFKIKDLKVDILQYLTEKYINKSYPDCKVDEGICIRNTRNNDIFKYKSPNFLLFEQKKLDEGVVSIEDEQ